MAVLEYLGSASRIGDRPDPQYDATPPGSKDRPFEDEAAASYASGRERRQVAHDQTDTAFGDRSKHDTSLEPHETMAPNHTRETIRAETPERWAPSKRLRDPIFSSAKPISARGFLSRICAYGLEQGVA